MKNKKLFSYKMFLDFNCNQRKHLKCTKHTSNSLNIGYNTTIHVPD